MVGFFQGIQHQQRRLRQIDYPKKSKIIFDFVICDEAHRTASSKREKDAQSNWTKVHHQLKAQKRLYITRRFAFELRSLCRPISRPRGGFKSQQNAFKRFGCKRFPIDNHQIFNWWQKLVAIQRCFENCRHSQRMLSMANPPRRALDCGALPRHAKKQIQIQLNQRCQRFCLRKRRLKRQKSGKYAFYLLLSVVEVACQTVALFNELSRETFTEKE